MNSIEKTPALRGGEDKPETTELPKPVYYVESTNDASVLVGIDVSFTSKNIGARRYFEVTWYDTVKERTMLASQVALKGDYFGFERDAKEGGGRYIFAPMDLATYDAKVREHLSDNAPSFDNYDDMIAAFMKSKENSY